jgi:hypothetical protein
MTKALPVAQQVIEHAMRSALKLGLPVTGVTAYADGSWHLNLVEQASSESQGPLTGGPKLRDAREKFRAG